MTMRLEDIMRCPKCSKNVIPTVVDNSQVFSKTVRCPVKTCNAVWDYFPLRNMLLNANSD